MFAFSIFDDYQDEETKKSIQNMNHTQYIDYIVELWSYEDPRNWTLLENLTTHRCNETDKKSFRQVGWPDGLDALWPFYFCLDNPEKI